MFTVVPFPIRLFLWKSRTCQECAASYRLVDPLVHLLTFGACCSHECMVENTINKLREQVYDDDDRLEP